jgi:hypothetical protein
MPTTRRRTPAPTAATEPSDATARKATGTGADDPTSPSGCAVAACAAAALATLAQAVRDLARATDGYAITITITRVVDGARSRDTARGDGSAASSATRSPREHPAAAARRLAGDGAAPQTRKAWADAIPGISARALGRAISSGVLTSLPRGRSRGHRAQLIRAADLADFLDVCRRVESGRAAPPAWFTDVMRPR